MNVYQNCTKHDKFCITIINLHVIGLFPVMASSPCQKEERRDMYSYTSRVKLTWTPSMSKVEDVHSNMVRKS